MKRLVLVFLLLLIACTVANAELDLGQVCFSTNGFPDTLRLWVKSATGDQVMFAIPAGAWSGLSYRLRAYGSASPSHPVVGNVILSLTLDNESGFFGNNPDCKLRATLNPNTWSGPMTMRCTGGSGVAFTNNTTLTITGCVDNGGARTAVSRPHLVMTKNDRNN